ncbi:TQO small subunit DoxD [uncultured Bacteroides sp.]|uniref:TQO small subunit DoxD n=1 Tax=uncultured Bacteroides sp. TaxID=162156 RepID=UPI002AA836B5|nr:TQO small subunit DoxD [uncultured Bacteroides sp.]
MTQSNHLPGMQQMYSSFAVFTLSLRLVVGWTYFSAFWRRLVLENKLTPDEAGYIGEKFNHFLPNALGIKPLIEYLVSNPEALWWAMAVFTIIEGIVGLLFMLGFFTRLMSIGVLSLAAGILLGSGWLGTTCLDEWQIGILGIAAGFTIFLSGSGKYSLDQLLINRKPEITNKKWFPWVASGTLPLTPKLLNRSVLTGSLVILSITLFTNQYFHNGVWGKLHNKSVAPVIELSDASLNRNELLFTVYRVEGVDVYGSFLIGITLEDDKGNIVMNQNGRQLSSLAKEDIKNDYIAKVKPGKHSLVIPLGAKARITIKDSTLQNLPEGNYKIKLTDISGITWEKQVALSPSSVR